MWLYRWKLLLVTHHPAKFNGQRSWGSKDITYLICHVILQDHVIKIFCDFIEESYSLFMATLPILLLWQWRYCIFNLSREFVKQCDQRTFWFYGGKLLVEFNNPARFGGHRHCGSGDSVFNLSWGLTWPHVQRVMEIWGWSFS